MSPGLNLGFLAISLLDKLVGYWECLRSHKISSIFVDNVGFSMTFSGDVCIPSGSNGFHLEGDSLWLFTIFSISVSIFIDGFIKKICSNPRCIAHIAHSAYTAFRWSIVNCTLNPFSYGSLNNLLLNSLP